MNWYAVVALAVAFWGWLAPTDITIREENPELAGPGVMADAGLRWDGHCEIRVYPARWPDTTERTRDLIIEHETGHCLGLQHIAGPGVMNSVFTPETVSTGYDWQEFQRVHPFRYHTTIPMVVAP